MIGVCAALAAAVAAGKDRGGPLERAFDGLVDETERVVEFVAGGGVGGSVLGLLAVAAALVLLGWLLRRQRRARGAEGQGLSVVVRLALQVLLLLFGAGIALHYLHRRVPLAALLAVLAVGLGALFSLGLMLRRWIAGVSVLARRLVNVGDELAVGEDRGVVEAVGLFRLTLRKRGGARLYLATSALADPRLEVASPQQAHPVTLTLQPQAPVRQEALQALEALVHLCPYREAGSKVSLEQADSGVLRIATQSWSAAGARQAEAYLWRAVEAALRTSAGGVAGPASPAGGGPRIVGPSAKIS